MYPVLEINTDAITENASIVCDILKKKEMSVVGVIKGSDGSIEVAKAYLKGGCSMLASSRVLHLKEIKQALPDVCTMLLRIPMISEAEDVAAWADYSLNSEKPVLAALSKAASKLKKTHSVVLMLDVGDRREGAVTVDELIDTALFANMLPAIRVAGIGTNYGCASGVLPDEENLRFLSETASLLEQRLGRRLDIVSGGSSSTLYALEQGVKYPQIINNARVGGYILNPMNMRINRGVDIPGMREDTLLLKAEIVELKDKPGVSPDHAGKNWKGETVMFKDTGVRKRALVAVGSQDIGDASNLIPVQKGVSVICGSSDHVILDVTDCERKLEVGDILEFRLRYGALLCAFSTRHIEKKYITDKSRASLTKPRIE